MQVLGRCVLRQHLRVALAHKPIFGRDVPHGDHADNLRGLHHGQVPKVAIEHLLKRIVQALINGDRLRIRGSSRPGPK